MKQSAGIITTVAVVLALFGISTLPRGSSGGGSENATPSAQETRLPTKAKGPSANYACGKIQERLQVLVADDRKQPWQAPESCYSDSAHPAVNAAAPPATDVAFVVATAPNPVSTHLAVLFDRIIEVIEQSAQDNNYSYDSSWLPWNDNKEYTRYSDQRAAEESQSEAEKQPGVLVFRKPLAPKE